MTASAAAQIPLKPANAAKSRTKAIVCRTKADTVELESITSGLFIGTDCLCLSPLLGTEKSCRAMRLPRCRVLQAFTAVKTPFTVSSIKPDPRPQASQLQAVYGCAESRLESARCCHKCPAHRRRGARGSSLASKGWRVVAASWSWCRRRRCRLAE
jgi:hypothetical protein